MSDPQNDPVHDPRTAQSLGESLMDLAAAIGGDRDALKRAAGRGTAHTQERLVATARAYREEHPDDIVGLGPEANKQVRMVLSHPVIAEGVLRALIVIAADSQQERDIALISRRKLTGELAAAEGLVASQQHDLSETYRLLRNSEAAYGRLEETTRRMEADLIEAQGRLADAQEKLGGDR
jgi:DnaJ-domain-containing protein 1